MLMFCHKEVQDPMPFVGTEPGNLYDFRITTCGGEFGHSANETGRASEQYKDELRF
jgi:hypothetical protein